MAATITYASSRVTISGAYKAFTVTQHEDIPVNSVEG
jgi:hypothetical protein